MKFNASSQSLAAAFLVTLGALSGPAGGAVTFSQSGNDLIVDILDPIVFTVTSSPFVAQSTYYLVFEDVYSTPITGFAAGSGQITDTSLMTINMITSSTPNISHFWSVSNATNSQWDSTDLRGGYAFSSAQNLSPGDTVVVSAGTITAANFFSDADGRLPDVTVSEVYLVEANSISLAPPAVVVPEPSWTLLLGIVGLLAIGRRRA